MGNREELIMNCRLAQQVICDCEDIDRELAELQSEIEVVTELSRKAIYENSRTAVNQEEFNLRNNSYIERNKIATERVATLQTLRRKRQGKFQVLERFIQDVESSAQAITEFDEGLWTAAVDNVTVEVDGRLVFQFKDGSEI